LIKLLLDDFGDLIDVDIEELLAKVNLIDTTIGEMFV